MPNTQQNCARKYEFPEIVVSEVPKYILKIS